MNRESIPGLGPEPGGLCRAPSRPFHGPCACLSWALPLGLALWSLRGEVSFRDDLGIVRDLGFARVGSEGVVSTLATQLLALLPLGGRALRASLPGVLALGFASRCFFSSVHAALERRGPGASHALLALLASSLWALGPAVQSEAARIGGALPAVALVACGVALGRIALRRGEPPALAAAGLVLGATLAESHAAGASLLLVLASLAAAERSRAWYAQSWRLLGAAAGTFCLLGSLRWIWPGSAPALPSSALTAAVLPSGALGAGPSALHGLAHVLAPIGTGLELELGAGALGLACAGAALAASLPPLRVAFAVWALPLALAAVAPAWLGVSADSAPLFGLLSSLGITAFFPVALQASVRWAWSSPLPLARPGAVLSLTFASTLVLSRLDQALLERPPERGATAWADEALGALPAGSLLLVQSDALALRLLASRALHGTRPDVTLVPAGLLGDGSIGRELSRSAPSLAPLLRQLWVNGVADEYSLAQLADVRSVFVQLDPGWDRRVLEHLRPDGLWLNYAASALGAAERRAGVTRSRAAARRVLEAARGTNDAGDELRARSEPEQRPGDLDPATRRALGDALAQQALSLGLLEEREPAQRLLEAVRHIDPRNPTAVQLGARLADPTRPRVAAAD